MGGRRGGGGRKGTLHVLQGGRGEGGQGVNGDRAEGEGEKDVQANKKNHILILSVV